LPNSSRPCDISKAASSGGWRHSAIQFRAESDLQTLTEDVLKSSEIEGEILDRNQVRSSISRRLGMDIGALAPTAPKVEGVVAMTLDATQRYQESLVADRLFGWHAALFPTGYSGLRRIATGTWRDDLEGPMQVVSGPIGADQVHFEAVPADWIEAEMAEFFDWFNGESAEDPVMKAAIAHLWFVTIHSLDDGNGRIARAITHMALARSDESHQRFYSISVQIPASVARSRAPSTRSPTCSRRPPSGSQSPASDSPSANER